MKQTKEQKRETTYVNIRNGKRKTPDNDSHNLHNVHINNLPEDDDKKSKGDRFDTSILRKNDNKIKVNVSGIVSVEDHPHDKNEVQPIRSKKTWRITDFFHELKHKDEDKIHNEAEDSS